MSLSDAERAIIAAAGTAPLQTARGQAVAIVLSKHGQDRELARAMLAESYLAATQPSFHLIPRGEAMASEAEFVAAYAVLAEATSPSRTCRRPRLPARWNASRQRWRRCG